MKLERKESKEKVKNEMLSEGSVGRGLCEGTKRRGRL